MEEILSSILFVDDEPNILKALRRMFADEDWEMYFAESGPTGLEILAQHPIDLVISDYRMPGMNGQEFLQQVQARYPQTARLFLSGDADKDSLASALAGGSAQMILPKPWDEDELRQVIAKALRQAKALRDKGDDLQSLINNIPSLPPLPEVYHEIQQCLADRDQVNFDNVASILEQDVGLTSSLLRWANSPIFGQMSKVDTLRRAIVILGLDVVEGLVLSDAVAESLEMKDSPAFNLDEFQRHSMGVGILARLLIKDSGTEVPMELLDQAFTAGLMHDLGKMVEARYFPIHLQQAYALAAREKGLMREAEKTLLGYGHDEIGGYLAAWWGLPQFIVQSVRWHHDPDRASGVKLIPAAVHVADALAQEFGLGLTGNHRAPDVNRERWDRFDLKPDYMTDLQSNVENALQV